MEAIWGEKYLGSGLKKNTTSPMQTAKEVCLQAVCWSPLQLSWVEEDDQAEHSKRRCNVLQSVSYVWARLIRWGRQEGDVAGWCVLTILKSVLQLLFPISRIVWTMYVRYNFPIESAQDLRERAS